VDQLNNDTIAVTRHNPVSHQSCTLIARTAFTMPGSMDGGGVPSYSVPGLVILDYCAIFMFHYSVYFLFRLLPSDSRMLNLLDV